MFLTAIWYYNANGNVLTISGINRPLLSPGTTDYSHTANRLTQSTGAEAKTYSYDGHGNTVSDGTKMFVYNQNNRLVRVTEGAVTLGEYAYDAFGRRVKKTVSGIVTVYHYDIAGNLIAETSAGGTLSRDVVYLNGERVAMKLYDSQDGWYFFINDHLGTPQKIVNASGEVVWAGFYQPFGKSWAYPATITNNFRFPGQYYDAETGLYYNWNRYYDPDTGRYLTPDPIGLEAGINLYAYAAGSPVNLIDPDGRNPLLIIWGIIEIALSVYDAYDTLQTVADPCAGDIEKGTAAGLFVLGMILPGGAYSSLDDVGLYLAKKAPEQITPGIKILKGQYIDDLGRVQTWTAHYDEYGRLTGRTDYNAGNKAAGIPDTHHHTREYNDKYPDGRRTGDHIQGEYKP